jgi:hypothetical protein
VKKFGVKPKLCEEIWGHVKKFGVKPKLYILQTNKLPAGKRLSSQTESGSYEETWAEYFSEFRQRQV